MPTKTLRPKVPGATVQTGDQTNTLPAGFPKSVVSPTAWSGADIKKDPSPERYTLTLTQDQITELEQACSKFQGLGLPLDSVSQETFPLPTIGSRLKKLAKVLTNGVSFFFIRGLDSNRYSSEMNVIIYLGISSYIGAKRGRQDEYGNMLLHLTDLGPSAAALNERQAPYSNVSQPFHTDTGDIIGLYSLGESECGGESQLVPMATVYNEIAKSRPDIIRLLASHSWLFDRFGQQPAYTIRPILFPVADDKVLLSFSRRPLVGSMSSPRSSGIPDLSSGHVEALNAVQFVGEQHAMSTKLKAGEMLFWNNLAMLHSRAGFTDAPGHRRHLLRLWLRNDDTVSGWPLPSELQASFEDAFEHAGRSQLWPIQPITERAYICNQQRSSGHD
ncbi:Clavaminate synthase-like protein [Cadophora sp. DSE1049]|nr:Clavaminate synthase-like protein [Cadophora sp. DSE1049]